MTHRAVKPSGLRRQDAIASAEWLSAQPGVPPGGIVLVGGRTAAGPSCSPPPATQRPRPACLLGSGVLPGCRAALNSGWAPSGPLMILVGANDDWTPAPPCEALAKKYPDLITLQVYPNAWHDFDRPDHPVAKRTGLATPPSGTGVAHAGTNPAARADALRACQRLLMDGKATPGFPACPAPSHTPSALLRSKAYPATTLSQKRRAPVPARRSASSR